MITEYQTDDGHTVKTIACDTVGCPIRINALGAAAVAKAEDIIRPDWLGRHYCPACQVRRGPGIAERPCPDPEHR